MQKTEPAPSPAEKDQAAEMQAKADGLKAKAEELKARAEAMKAKAGQIEAEAEEIRVRFEEAEAKAEEIKAKAEAIKARIAETVRSDSQERSSLTPEDAIVDLDDDFRYGRTAVGSVLNEMAADERYQDIKSITTATGLVFVYSDAHIVAEEAAAKSLVEEAKSILANAIRADSYQKAQLTPVGALYALAPDTDQAIVDALLRGMLTEPRYADIKTVTASNGNVYFHSERYLVGSYAATLLMAMAGDHFVTIAETVREESRIYPRTTNVAIFREQQVYGIPPADLDAIVAEMLRKPECADIRSMAHPVTGAVHLYCNRYISEERAWAMMDWEEVGRAENP